VSAVLKGALVTFLPGSTQPSIIGFQLNPETITHTLMGPACPPVETFGFSLVLDQSERLDAGDVNAVARQLTALEALLFPLGGQFALAPAVLFAWGRGRLIPVRVSSLNIIEKRFDAQLNPTQAEAAVTLVALTQQEIAAAEAPMAALAGAAYDELAKARIRALQYAQRLDDPGQSSAGRLV
jgi:hypothetical protein